MSSVSTTMELHTSAAAISMAAAMRLVAPIATHLALGSPDLDELTSLILGGRAWLPPKWSVRAHRGQRMEPLEMWGVTRRTELTDAFRAIAWNDGIGDLAGRVAEARWLKRSRMMSLTVGRKLACSTFEGKASALPHDLRRVRARLAWLYRVDPQIGFYDSWMAAEDIVAEAWPRIVHVARLTAGGRNASVDELLAIWKRLPECRTFHARLCHKSLER